MFKISKSNTYDNIKPAELFNTAVDYLRMSDLARFVIDQLAEAEATIQVKVCVPLTGINSWDPPAIFKGDSGGTVVWTAGRNDKKDYEEHGSAAMSLMHELGHAYQYLSEKKRVKVIIWRKRLHLFPFGNAEKIFLKNIEDTNTAIIEFTVENEINKALIYMYGPGYKWLEPVRTTYQDEGTPVIKRFPDPKEYVAELRKEGKSPPPVFGPAAAYDPGTTHYLTLIKPKTKE